MFAVTPSWAGLTAAGAAFRHPRDGPTPHSTGMEAEAYDDVLATAGDFLVYLCCCGADGMWVERVSTGEAFDLPKAEVGAVLGMPEAQRAAALDRLWVEHF